MIGRLKIATYRLRPDETIRRDQSRQRGVAADPAPRPIFERARDDFANWVVHRIRIASVLIVVRYWKGVRP